MLRLEALHELSEAEAKAALALGAVLAAFAAACGDESVPVNDYANALCTARADFAAALRELEENAELDEFVRGAVGASDELVDDIEAAGVPDVADGGDIAAAFRDLAEEIRDELEGAQEAVDELPTRGAREHAVAVDDFVSDLGRTFESINERLADVDSPQLQRALHEASACQVGEPLVE